MNTHKNVSAMKHCNKMKSVILVLLTVLEMYIDVCFGVGGELLQFTFIPPFQSELNERRNISNNMP